MLLGDGGVKGVGVLGAKGEPVGEGGELGGGGVQPVGEGGDEGLVAGGGVVGGLGVVISSERRPISSLVVASIRWTVRWIVRSG